MARKTSIKFDINKIGIVLCMINNISIKWLNNIFCSTYFVCHRVNIQFILYNYFLCSCLSESCFKNVLINLFIYHDTRNNINVFPSIFFIQYFEGFFVWFECFRKNHVFNSEKILVFCVFLIISLTNFSIINTLVTSLAYYINWHRKQKDQFYTAFSLRN